MEPLRSFRAVVVLSLLALACTAGTFSCNDDGHDHEVVVRGKNN